ncbi:MAG: hypothetical protein ACI8PW_001344 [Methylophilaceae bacterium]|jgi:hypothetical protein
MQLKVNNNAMKYSTDLMKAPFFIVAFTILIHSIFIFAPTVNLEFSFVDATEYFSFLNPVQLDQYFFYQANTLALSYFTHLVSAILPNVTPLVLIRLTNLIGLVLLTIGIKKICHYLNIKNYTILLLLIVLNPLVWTYSGRATADFLPVAVGIFSVSLVLGSGNIYLRSLVSGLLLGLSVTLKYHSLSLLVFMAVLLLLKEKRAAVIIKMSIVTAITFLILGFYLVIIKFGFGFWITPEKYQEVHRLNFLNIINNLILYLGFLGLLTVPTFFLSKSFYEPLQTKWKHILIIFTALLLFGAYLSTDMGELNFGPLDSFFNSKLRLLMLSLLCLVTVMLTFMSNQKESKIRSYLWLVILLTLLVFSISRPAQRYLLFIIPFFILALPEKIIECKKLISTTIIIFVLANSFIELSRWSTGTAAILMTKRLEKGNLIKQTNPGAIEAHVGNFFFSTKDAEKLYIVVSGKSDKSIFTSTAGLGIYKKSFSLEKIN